MMVYIITAIAPVVVVPSAKLINTVYIMLHQLKEVGVAREMIDAEEVMWGPKLTWEL